MEQTRAIIAFVLVLAGGLAFLLSGKFVQPEPNGQYGAILDSQKLGGYAREVCGKALRDKVDGPLFAPTEIRSGGRETVILSWQPTSRWNHRAECRYQQARGISALWIDGRELETRGIDIGGDPSNPGAGKQTESHWGHWQ